MLEAMSQRPLLPATWRNLYYPPEKGKYTYFIDRERYPFPTPRNIQTLYGGTDPRLPLFVKAAYAADASLLSYRRWGTDPMTEQEFKQILSGFECRSLVTGEATGTQGYFASQEDFAILAFRGTEKDDPKDAVTDISALPVSEPDYSTAPDEPQTALRHLSIIEALFHRCRVHHGFQLALNDVWEEVHQHISGYRRTHPQSEICFTGHSLGAALATLAASRFGGRGASLVTFGSPRTGNQEFCERVGRNADLGVFRFVNGADPVTHVPLEDPVYRHTAPPLLFIDSSGDIQELASAPAGDWADLAETLEELPQAGFFNNLDSQTAADLADHSPARYSIRLWNYTNRLGGHLT
jgi:triacylglycerol lipase